MPKKSNYTLGFQIIYFGSLPLLSIIVMLVLENRDEQSNQSSVLKLLAGAITCIILEIYLLTRIYKTRIDEESYDLGKFVKEQIGEWFGNLPENYIKKRNDRRYYIPLDIKDDKEKQLNNRLFLPQNHELYTKIINHMKSKSKIEFKLKELYERTQTISKRIKITKDIYNFLTVKQAAEYEQYKQFKNLFVKYENYHFYKEECENQTMQQISWKNIINTLTEAAKASNANSSETKNLCYKLINKLAQQIKGKNDSAIKSFEISSKNYEKSTEKYKEIYSKIETLRSKVKTMSEEYNFLKKKHEDYQKQLNTELNIRLSKIELANLQVKLYNAEDEKLKNYQMARVDYQNAEIQIQNSEKQNVYQNFKTMFNEFLRIQTQCIERIQNRLGRKHRQQSKYSDLRSKDHEAVYLSEQYHSVEQNMGDLKDLLEKWKYLEETKNKQRDFSEVFYVELIQKQEGRIRQIKEQQTKFEKELKNLEFKDHFFEVKIIKLIKIITQNRQQFLDILLKCQLRTRQKNSKYNKFYEIRHSQILTITNEINRLNKYRSKMESHSQVNELIHNLNKIICDLEEFSLEKSSEIEQIYHGYTTLLQNNLKAIENQMRELEHLDRVPQKYEDERESKLSEYLKYYNSIKKEEAFDQNIDKAFLNKLLGVYCMEWQDSEYFHSIVKKELYLALNRKRPDILDELAIETIKIKKYKQPSLVQTLIPLESEIFNFKVEAKIRLEGSVKIIIKSKIKINGGIGLVVKIDIKRVAAKARISYTPLKLGKSWISLMQLPELEMNLEVLVGNFSLSKIPFMSKIIEAILAIKIKKLIVWPMRVSINFPLSIKDTRVNAVQQRLRYLRQQEDRLKRI